MPWEVDKAPYDFGFPMGHFAMWDMAGLDIGWIKEKSHSATILEVLCEMGRFGQKNGHGYYDYDADRNATPSPIAEQVVRDFAAKSGLPQRAIGPEEIIERCLYPMVNEGAKILEEGIAIRSSDIDMVWQTGYGWPAYRGGPMFWAGQVGLDKVAAALKALEARFGAAYKPATLLEKLAAEGKRVRSLRPISPPPFTRRGAKRRNEGGRAQGR